MFIENLIPPTELDPRNFFMKLLETGSLVVQSACEPPSYAKNICKTSARKAIMSLQQT
jgi:hypothetical protein